MNILVLPAMIVLGAFLSFLYLSKENKDGLSAVLLTLFGAEGVVLIAIMLYDDVLISHELWKFIILTGILVLLISSASLEAFGKIPYNPEPHQES